MPNRKWYHASGNGICFGFAVNKDFIVVECGEKGFQHIYGKCVKDASVRKWFVENNICVTEVKIESNGEETVQ